ncbi:hypothetical protein GPALN_003497 [Globodera pallida]|nr:hypothetical protein GPALN_003497 [Globodera pallida]
MLTSGMVRELKASTSAWETFGCRAAKLASQLQQVATAFGSFVDGLQTISDSANSVNGVSRDIGAALTRFCLRQRSVELAIRKWGDALQKQCADDLGRRSGEWRQTVSDLERRHQRNCKRFKTSGGGKHNNKNRQQIEAESRNFYIELLHAQRAQCTEFVVGTLLPIINAQMVLLDEGAHIQPILDSLETSVNENDTAKLVQALLEDIDACSGANGHGVAPKRGENDDQLAWDQRIGIGMALGRAKSASQARLFGVGPERAVEEDDHSLNYGSTALLTAHRNSMPPPSGNSHQQLFSSCPSSAAATISSSSSSAFVVGSPASKGNNCGGAVGSGDGAAEDIWQQNISRNVPSSHQRMPLPQPFVHHQMAAERADIVSPTSAADTLPQNQCQKPPMPAGWGRQNCHSQPQQQHYAPFQQQQQQQTSSTMTTSAVHSLAIQFCAQSTKITPNASTAVTSASPTNLTVCGHYFCFNFCFRSTKMALKCLPLSLLRQPNTPTQRILAHTVRRH